MIPHPYWDHGKRLRHFVEDTALRSEIRQLRFENTMLRYEIARLQKVIQESQSTHNPLESETGKGEMGAGDHK